MRILRYATALSLITWFAPPAIAQEGLNLEALVRNGSVRVERQDGSPVIRHRDEEGFVPASILKVATSYCALETLGTDYRYETLFLADKGATLFIRGSGDPSLVSETLEAIAIEIVTKLPRIDRIIIDTTLFADDIVIDGSERSTNPYDAKNAAFVGNFSSAFLSRTRTGEIRSAESQTPLTPLAREAGTRVPKGKTERVNLSTDWKIGVRYGGELLAEFLRRHGATGAMTISRGSTSANAKVIHTHRSPQNLGEMTQAMLKYSTNFTANQVFLTLGVHQFQAPATVTKAQRAMRECLEERAGWRDFHIEEGSGLSRKNRVSARQMTELLKRFERYSQLLPEQDGFLAKTGTLRGVNTLAGYFEPDERYGRLRFSILINSEVPPLYKYRVANELRNYLKKQCR